MYNFKELKHHEKMYVETSKCIACNTCQLACAFSQYAKGHTNTKPRITPHRTSENHGIPVVCLQCEDPACVKVCPTKALHKNEELGIIDIDQEKCIHCNQCIVACPFGNITKDQVENRIAKCDLCNGNPTCAMFCPTGALRVC